MCVCVHAPVRVWEGECWFVGWWRLFAWVLVFVPQVMYYFLEIKNNGQVWFLLCFLWCGNPLAMANRHLIGRSSLLRPLQDLGNGTLRDTRNRSKINLSMSFTRRANNELQYLTCDIGRYCLKFANSRLEGRFNSGIRVNLAPCAHSADLPIDLSN